MSSVLPRPSDQLDQQRARTRRRIINATGQLLTGGSAFAGLSIGEISEQANVSRPTFYSYFADKRALVLFLAAEFEEDARAAAKPWLEDETDDLRATLEEVLAVFSAHSSTVGAVVEAATYHEEVADFWRGFHEWFILSATRRAMAEDADLGSQAAEALAYSLVWMTERCFTEHLSDSRLETAALLDALERLWHTVVSEPKG